MNNHKKKSLLAAALAAVTGFAGYGLHAFAEGAPTAQPLWYSGTVSDPSGTPFTGNHQVWLRLYAQPTGASATLCTSGPASVPFDKGRFRVEVSNACVDAIKSNPDLFVEVSVDEDTKPFPRSKIGAVPYAIEAQHAVTASGATGALKQALEQQPKITAWEAFTPELYSGSQPVPLQTKTGSYRRVGDSVEVRYTFGLKAGTTPPPGQINFRLPNNLQVDTKKFAGSAGHGLYLLTSGPTSGLKVVAIDYQVSNNLFAITYAAPLGDGYLYSGSLENATGGLAFSVTVPVEGWTASTP